MAAATPALEKKAAVEVEPKSSVLDKKMSAGPGRIGMVIAGAAMVIGLIYAGGHLLSDLETVHPTSYLPFLLLGVALLTALAFEFVHPPLTDFEALRDLPHRPLAFVIGHHHPLS